MNRNISNTLLVLFAVVLILPAFQGDGFLSGSTFNFDCTRIVNSAGPILCKLHGSKDMSAYLPRTCQVWCYDANQKLKLHPKACLMGSLECTENLKQNLLKWKDEMEKTKAQIINDWCPK
uniref:Putative ixodes 10 kDa peptide protein n=1 Tax=Ixodes ricinus TaxID=34613 RepID=A0A0K8R4A7_IXORI